MMDFDRHQVSILFDAWNDAGSDMFEQIECKKAERCFKYRTSFLSYILHGISDYMRVLFDLNSSFLTFDVLACGTGNNKMYSQCNIQNDNFLNAITKFQYIYPINDIKQTKFVETISKYLLDAPSDFTDENVNCRNKLIDVIFIARYNDKYDNNLQSYTIEIEQKKENDQTAGTKQINFANLMQAAKIRNPFIQRVFIIRYYKNEMNEATNQESEKMKQEWCKVELCKDNNDNNIECWQCLINIESLYEIGLTQLIDRIQFKSLIDYIPIINVPMASNKNVTNIAFPVSLFVSKTNVNDKSLFNYINYFNGNSSNKSDENDEKCLESLEWNQQITVSSWQDIITIDIKQVSLAKLDEYSRLLIKFLNKRKIAYLGANYINKQNGIKTNANCNRSTHAIRNIGMKLYLCQIICCHDIPFYNSQYNGVSDDILFDKNNFAFEWKQYCLQSDMLPKMANYQLNHSLSHLQSPKMIDKLLNIKAPFMYDDSNDNNETKNENSKEEKANDGTQFNVMQINGRQQQYAKQESINFEKNKDLGKQHLYVTNSGFVECLNPYSKQIEETIGAPLMAHCIKNETKFDRNESTNVSYQYAGINNKSLYDLQQNYN